MDDEAVPVDDEAVPVPPIPELELDSLPKRQVALLVGEIPVLLAHNRWPHDEGLEDFHRRAQQLGQELRDMLDTLPETAEAAEVFDLVDYLDTLADTMITEQHPRKWYLDAVDSFRDQIAERIEFLRPPEEAAAFDRFRDTALKWVQAWPESPQAD